MAVLSRNKFEKVTWRDGINLPVISHCVSPKRLSSSENRKRKVHNYFKQIIRSMPSWHVIFFGELKAFSSHTSGTSTLVVNPVVAKKLGQKKLVS